MKNIGEYLKKKKTQEYTRKDRERRDLITEITRRLNEERTRENEDKIEKYRWVKQVSRETAIKELKKEKDPSKKIYEGLYTERGIFFKTRHLDTPDLMDFFNECNEKQKDGRSFSIHFNKELKI